MGLSKWWEQQNLPVLPSCRLSAKEEKEKENEDGEKLLTPNSDENNEGGRFIQCGAVY